MEVVPATAAILGILGFTLNLSKDIYGVITALKDGPQGISQLANDVAQLQTVLERVISLPSEAVNSSDLSHVVNRCAADITSLKSKLGRLVISPTEKRTGLFWKRLKAIISEKELPLTRQTIHNHVLMLNVHLSLGQTSQLLGSTSQLTIFDLLNQLKNDVAGLAAPAPILSSEDSTPTTAEAATAAATIHNPIRPILDGSITRLIDLVNSSEQTVESDEAAELIDDLQQLLYTAQNQYDVPSPGASLNPQESRAGGEDSVRRELRLVESLVFSRDQQAW